MIMKINFLLFSILLFNCTASQPTPKLELTVMQQLESDHENGKLSDDEYFTYLTYSVFAQDLLPEKNKGNIGIRDATPIIRKIQRAYPTLSPAKQEHLKQWIKPLPSKPPKSKVKP
jgi:hypothetical protein